MTTNYDPIAEQYKRAKQQPWRAHVEAFTLMSLIGDTTGKAVIDIACGEGFYTRMIRQQGAAKVIGLDLSERMIALGRAAEAGQHLGIEYLVGDGRNVGIGATAISRLRPISSTMRMTAPSYLRCAAGSRAA
jgi:ubiquinone/menaquinone biosynthesis C-methylase UbiE